MLLQKANVESPTRLLFLHYQFTSVLLLDGRRCRPLLLFLLGCRSFHTNNDFLLGLHIDASHVGQTFAAVRATAFGADHFGTSAPTVDRQELPLLATKFFGNTTYQVRIVQIQLT